MTPYKPITSSNVLEYMSVFPVYGGVLSCSDPVRASSGMCTVSVSMRGR